MYLVGGRLVFETRLVEDGLDLVFVEVGDADGLDQPVIHQLLHSLRDTVDWCWDVSLTVSLKAELSRGNYIL